MKILCDFLAQNLEHVTYMDEIDEEYEEVEEEYEETFPDQFQTVGTNTDERKITLPQPNGEISKPLKLDIGHVSVFFRANTSDFYVFMQCALFVCLLRNLQIVKIYLRDAGIDARYLRNDMKT